MGNILNSIIFRLIIAGVLLTLGGTAFRLMIALPKLQDQVRDLVASQQLSVATYVARDIDASIIGRLRLVETLAGEFSPPLLKDPAALLAWLKERQRINPLFNNGLVVIAPDGKSLLGEYPVVTGRDRLDYSRIDWFRRALVADRAVIGKPVRGRASGVPLIVMAHPLRDASGSVVALLAGVSALDAPGFLDRLQETKLGVSGGFLLISPEDKLFVASSDPGMILQPTPPPGVNLLHDRAMVGYRGTGVTINAKGVEELSAIVSVPSTGWFVVARMPTTEAFQPVEALRNQILRNSLLTIVAVIAVFLLVLPRMLRPLRDASRAIRRMAEGSSELAPLPVVRNDEIGSLVSGFNLLVARLLTKDAALRASEQRLEFMAHHDGLTGLPNRAMLEDRLDQALARAERDGSQVALLFCDLDGFKPVNDEFGHAAGDRILRQVSDRLVDGRRRSDTVARLGGDEFVILLSDIDDARASAKTVAEQCLRAMQQPFSLDERSVSLGVSIGIAVHAGRSVAPSHLLSQADTAMYVAKRAGKGRFAFSDES